MVGGGILGAYYATRPAPYASQLIDRRTETKASVTDLEHIKTVEFHNTQPWGRIATIITDNGRWMQTSPESVVNYGGKWFYSG